jgi:uncharacterized phiE125 gp8 family phage protein
MSANYNFDYPWVSAYDSVWDSFGTLRLTETGTPQTFTEPLLLTDVKTHLRIDESFTADDTLINTFISAARYQAEIMQNRDLIRKQWDLTYDYWPQYRIELRAPAISVDLMQYTDLAGNVTTMSVNTDYVTDLRKEPGIVTPPWNISWPAFTPYPSGAILIRFTSGYAADAQWWSGPGALVKAGMLLLISAWYENRLPFVQGISATSEYPYAVTHCLSAGALTRAR